MSLHTLDLNLLLVFQHLLRHRSVSGAATALGLSQPATSHALRRLREALQDELFLRTPQGMEPTPYALQLAEPVSQALALLQDALSAHRHFDPATSTRRFTVAMSDVGEVHFLPRLMQALADQAPGVTLATWPLSAPDLKAALARGEVDLALGLLPQLQAGFYQQVLFHQPYVCLMRADHPLAAPQALTRDQYEAAHHVQVLPTGTGHGRVDEALARLGVLRQVRLWVHHYVALGPVLATTDLLATVPERLARHSLAPFGLALRPLPLPVADTVIHQSWHARQHQDPGLRWLRALIAQCFGSEGAITSTGAASSH